MNSILNYIDSIVNGIAQQVGNALNGVISTINNDVQNAVIRPITQDISGALGTIGDTLNYIGYQASNGIANTLNAVGNSFAQVETQVAGGFQTALGAVQQGISSAESGIVNAFNLALQAIESGFTDIQGGISQTIRAYSDVLGNVFTQWGNAFNAVFTTTIQPLAHFIEQLPADITVIAEKLAGSVVDLGKILEQIGFAIEFVALPKGIAEIQKGMAIIGEAALGEVVQPIAGFLAKSLINLAGIDISSVSDRAIGKIVEVAAAEAALGAATEFAPSMAFILSHLIDEIASHVLVGDIRELDYAGNLSAPNKIFEAGQLVEGRFRKVVSDEQYYDEFKRAGVDSAHADGLYALGAQLIGTSDLVTLYRRGIITDHAELIARARAVRADERVVDDMLRLYDVLIDPGSSIEMWRRDVVPEGFKDAFDDLRSAGWTSERIASLQAISYKIPSVFEYQDFIARKVYDPAHVEKFQLDYGITEEYFKNAKANGFNHDTAQAVYRSYWNLPPFFIIANEYKSGKISEQDMRDILAFQRFTPYWIDRFVDSLKPALTQADIKDMYKYQVIASVDIVPELVKLGTAANLAEQLSELWQASVKRAAPNDQSSGAAAAVKVKDETVSLVKTAYKDRILTKIAATQKLKDLGETDTAAALIVEIADYEVMQVQIKETYQMVKADIASGNMTLNDAINALTQAGASTFQLDLYTAELQRGNRSKPKVPTIAEFETWYKKGIINAQQLYNGLSFIGWSDNWIPYFMQIAGVKVSDIITIVPNASSPI